jgi:hypothetical protein
VRPPHLVLLSASYTAEHHDALAHCIRSTRIHARKIPPNRGLLSQCHLAYRSIKALTCMFALDGQSDPAQRPERICAGQSRKGGQNILQDHLRLSGIAS